VRKDPGKSNLTLALKQDRLVVFLQMPVKSCVDLEVVADSSSPADRSVHTPLFSFPAASIPSDVVVYSYFVVMTLSAAVRCPIAAPSSDRTNIHTGKHWHSNEGIAFGHFRE